MYFNSPIVFILDVNDRLASGVFWTTSIFKEKKPDGTSPESHELAASLLPLNGRFFCLFVCDMQCNLIYQGRLTRDLTLCTQRVCLWWKKLCYSRLPGVGMRSWCNSILQRMSHGEIVFISLMRKWDDWEKADMCYALYMRENVFKMHVQV